MMDISREKGRASICLDDFSDSSEGFSKLQFLWIVIMIIFLLSVPPEKALGNVRYERNSVIEVYSAYYCFDLNVLRGLVLVDELGGERVFNYSLKAAASLGKCGVIWGDLFLMNASGKRVVVLSIGNQEVTFTAFDAYSGVLHKYIWVWGDSMSVRD